MENRGSAYDVDDVVKDSSGDGMKKTNFAEEFSPDLPSVATSSGPSGSSLYASLKSSSASKDHDKDGRDVAHGTVRHCKKLELAPSSETIHVPGVGMVDSLEKPPVVSANYHDISPGAFPVRSSRNTATSRTFRSPVLPHDSTRQSTSEESKEEEGVTNSAGVYAGAYDSSRVAAESGLFLVEAQRVPDGNEDGTMMVAETEYVRTKRYNRPLYRWIFVGLALFACGLLDVAKCQSIVNLYDTATVGSTIPTEIGLLTQLAALGFFNESLTSTIPTEIGLLTKLGALSFWNNSLTSTIPSEIGLLTQLTWLDFSLNSLTSSIPSEIGLLTQLMFLAFYVNQLTSTIPTEIGLLTKLAVLGFSNNSMTSTIPNEIGLLTQLSFLEIALNSLTSTIPSEIGLLTELTGLGVGGNLLTSTIPSEIGLLTQLMSLSFYDNALTSAVPSEISLLTQLTVLFLNENTLEGSIPSSLCSLPSLGCLFCGIFIDCDEITCDSGCCYGTDRSFNAFRCG
ncbi:hypothetical protein MHU86_1547 [Fragilaria crotonensis]|nr:hypothetical protein MHU86_1547 [Fragilaria crotonensis]